MNTVYHTLQIRVRKEQKSYFESLFLDSKAKTKSQFLQTLIEAYINYCTLNYNALLWELDKLRAENQNMQALKLKNEQLEEKICKIYERAATLIREKV